MRGRMGLEACFAFGCKLASGGGCGSCRTIPFENRNERIGPIPNSQIATPAAITMQTRSRLKPYFIWTSCPKLPREKTPASCGRCEWRQLTLYIEPTTAVVDGI